MLLTEKDITIEFAENFLDKLHLAMSKINPHWMDEVMESTDDTEVLSKIAKLKIHAYKWVLSSSGKGFDDKAKRRLSQELKKLGEETIQLFILPSTIDELKKEQENEKLIQKSKLPTQAQLDAGNYKKKHIKIHGFDIAIENKKNSYRSGVDKSGKSWKCKIYFDYGYIKGTKGADGDHVDVFIGPNPKSEIIFIINQIDPNSKEFDEHKVMMGFSSEDEAKVGYLKNYEKNWKGLGSIISLTIDQFKEWLEKGSQKKELINPKLEFLKADLERIIQRNKNEICVLKSQLAIQPVVVHGKSGNYIQMRKVKIGNETPPSQGFQLQSDKYKKPKIRSYQERPKYKIMPEDSLVSNLVTNIKDSLLRNGQHQKAKEFTDLAFIAQTVDDIYEIANDFVELQGNRAKHRKTENDEQDLFKSINGEPGMRIQSIIKSAIILTKSQIRNESIDILKGGKRRKDGETWTQPSGRKVTKKNGRIIPVFEKKSKNFNDSKSSKSHNKNETFTATIKDGYDISKLVVGKRIKKGDKTYEVVSAPSKNKQGKYEAAFKMISLGGKIGSLPDKAIQETKVGGFAKTSDNISELVKEAVKTSKKELKKENNSTVKTEKGVSIPTSLPFASIKRAEQYTAEKDFDKDNINSLKERILENGYDPSFPVMVDKQNGVWTVVAGHHRHIAVEQLIEEGKLPSSFQIPVVTKEFASDNDRIAAQVSENQRRNVLPTDEAKAYGKMQKNGWDAKKIAEKLGKKPGDVNKRLALNNLESNLFALVKSKDRSLPLGVAEVLGMFGKDVNGNPSHTIQLKAFKWYVENRSKYPGRGPSVVQSYIKDLHSGDLAGMDFDSVASDAQKEALRTIGSQEKAVSNKKMIDGMLDSLMKSYQRILGENISEINPQTVKELAASLTLSGGTVGGSPVLGKLEAVIQDLSLIKDKISQKMKEIEADSQTPMMFGFAKSILGRTNSLINLFEEEKEKIIEISKGKVA
jgi:ParB/RepB/Spo0J family partition protein